jgi:hypothetical protein
MKRFAVLAFASFTALALVACQKEEAGETPAAAAKATANPADAITATAKKLRSNDVLGVIQLTVPPKHYEKMKADWKADLNKEPVTEADRAEFQAMMAKLTAPDAETVLMAEAEPELVKFETEMAAQMPLMVGMGQGFAMQAIQANESLSAAQKKQAADVLGAVVAWLQGVQFADRALAKQAIGHAVGTARALNLKTLDEARALEFEPAMQKAGVAFKGIKDVLAVYGLKLDEAFDSVKANVVSETGDNAVVKVDYTIFNQPLSFESPMVKIDGRWYGKDTVDQLEKAAKAPVEVAAPADGSTAPDAGTMPEVAPEPAPEAAPAGG